MSLVANGVCRDHQTSHGTSSSTAVQPAAATHLTVGQREVAGADSPMTTTASASGIADR
jgi:hypothetical protein